MGTEVINSSFDVLQEELEKAKSTLKGLNDNIRRISGREPPEQLRGDRKRLPDRRNDRDRNNDYGLHGDSRNRLSNRGPNDRDRERDRDRDRDRERDSSPPAKRKMETKSVFSRLSGPPSNRDDDIKPKLNSRIIRELPTKEEIVEAQGTDPASQARNRRMFGSLLGTLQKFCQEESRLKQKEQKKAQIEKKLEDQQNQEREIMKKERQNLYNNRKRQQLEIKMLENKMNLMKEFSTWEESKKPLMNFIRTKTKPRICYLPKVLDKRTERKLEECKLDVEKQIEKRRAEVNEEMADIVNRFELATESLRHTSDNTKDENAQSASALEQNNAANQMDQSEDDSYYQNNLKSSIKEPTERSNKRDEDSSNHGEGRDDSSTDDADNEKRINSQKQVAVKVERNDEHPSKDDKHSDNDQQTDDDDDYSKH